MPRSDDFPHGPDRTSQIRMNEHAANLVSFNVVQHANWRQDISADTGPQGSEAVMGTEGLSEGVWFAYDYIPNAVGLDEQAAECESSRLQQVIWGQSIGRP